MFRILKRLWNGLKNLFKKEPITTAATVVAVPVILLKSQKIALFLGITNPVLFTIAIAIILIPSVGRMLWNAQ